MISLTTKSNIETKKLGYKIAKFLKKGSVVSLNGDLGSGKTVLVSGIASFFDIENEVSSPTFTIVNEYNQNKIDCPLYHFDVYRLKDSEEFISIGLDEYFYNGICIIEWGNIIQDILPKHTIHINISKDNDIKIENEDIRYINIEGIDKL